MVAALRSQVVGGEIVPGQKLPTESQLTETFGVSRTVIREAIASLAADGLVEARQGAGVFVMDHPALAFGSISQEIGKKISQALNVLEVRMGIEIESAGLAALRRNSAQEARIQEAFFEFERLLDAAAGDRQGGFRLPPRDRRRRPTIRSMSRCSMRSALAPSPATSTSPWGTDSVLTREYQDGLQREHLVILNAISAGDPQAARDAMRAHLTASQQRYRARLSGQQAEYLRASRSPRL